MSLQWQLFFIFFSESYKCILMFNVFICWSESLLSCLFGFLWHHISAVRRVNKELVACVWPLSVCVSACISPKFYLHLMQQLPCYLLLFLSFFKETSALYTQVWFSALKIQCELCIPVVGVWPALLYHTKTTDHIHHLYY